MPSEQLASMPTKFHRDSYGLPLEIVYPFFRTPEDRNNVRGSLVALSISMI
jgi:hypothetical protein